MNYNLLKLERVKLGLTQEQVAEKLNISATAYSKKENGHTDFSLNQLKILKSLFNLNIEQFNEIFLQ